MENIKLSIIVPVYNVAPYLRKCVISLIHQDFRDYEIVLIDDGSTDDSSKICDELSETISDERLTIRVIHKENGGLSAARNAGLKIAKGEYVCFVDSDDYWEENVLGKLIEQVEQDNFDVLRFDYRNVRLTSEGMNELTNEGKYEVFQPYKRDHRLDNDYSSEVTDGITFLNERMGTQCYAVMFVVRRSLLVESQESRVKSQGCLFTEGIYFEDTDWTPRMLCRAKRVASTNTIVYNYLIRQGSITNAVNRSKQQKVLDDKMRLIGEMERQAEVLRKEGKVTKWFDRMIADTVISIMGIISVQFYVERATYIEQIKQMKVLPIYGTSMKARLINISPRLMVGLLHLKNGK